MFDIFKNRLELVGTLKTVTALRVSKGRSLEPIGADLPVVKDALGRPLIPGSSFKGAMRSRLESFLRGIDPLLAANPAIEEEWAIPSQDVIQNGHRIDGMTRIKKALNDKQNLDASQKDKQLTETILNKTDLASLIFGSPWMSSKFQVRDLTVSPENWFGQYQERDGVAIDRDTETAADGKLYSFQVVPAGTPFEFRALVENAEAWELGLLMIGLHQFETQQIPIGGGRSRGLGVVALEKLQARWIDVRQDTDKTKSDPDKMKTYLKQLVGVDGNQLTAFAPIDESQRKAWVQSLISALPDQSARMAATRVVLPISSQQES
ncbi:MAG: CRISPR-associated RAMP protein Csx7 [Cyanobacteria bacterium J06634_5]